MNTGKIFKKIYFEEHRRTVVSEASETSVIYGKRTAVIHNLLVDITANVRFWNVTSVTNKFSLEATNQISKTKQTPHTNWCRYYDVKISLIFSLQTVL